jgi:hypothetical protein
MLCETYRLVHVESDVVCDKLSGIGRVVANLKVHLDIPEVEMNINVWSKLIMVANFWPGCREVACVTADLNQTIFISLFILCVI